MRVNTTENSSVCVSVGRLNNPLLSQGSRFNPKVNPSPVSGNCQLILSCYVYIDITQNVNMLNLRSRLMTFSKSNEIFPSVQGPAHLHRLAGKCFSLIEST